MNDSIYSFRQTFCLAKEEYFSIFCLLETVQGRGTRFSAASCILLRYRISLIRLNPKLGSESNEGGWFTEANLKWKALDEEWVLKLGCKHLKELQSSCHASIKFTLIAKNTVNLTERSETKSEMKRCSPATKVSLRNSETIYVSLYVTIKSGRKWPLNLSWLSVAEGKRKHHLVQRSKSRSTLCKKGMSL